MGKEAGQMERLSGAEVKLSKKISCVLGFVSFSREPQSEMSDGQKYSWGARGQA